MNESINPESGSALEADDNSQLEIPSLEDISIAQHEIERMEVIRRFENGMYPYEDRIKKSEYEKEKALLQVELLKVQRWVKASGMTRTLNRSESPIHLSSPPVITRLRGANIFSARACTRSSDAPKKKP